MGSTNVRRALSLLPPCATTGVGSLPHTQLELALQATLLLDVPALPQLPAGNSAELMLPSALEGLPGLTFDEEGLCAVRPLEWEKGKTELDRRLDAAIEGRGLEQFEPSPLSCRAWQPFLWEIASRKLAFAKAQLAGPATVRWVTRLEGGEVVANHPQLDRQIYRLLLARGLAMVRALRGTGAVPLVFLDEPGLYGLEPVNPRHAVVLQELRMMVIAMQRQGALVGLHCCSDTRWAQVMALGVDILSLDMRLSLDALLEEPAALRAHFEAGGRLSLGIVPTDVAAAYEIQERVASAKTALGSVAAASDLLLTPACGLGMRTVPDAEQILEELRQAQRAMRSSFQEMPRAAEEQP